MIKSKQTAGLNIKIPFLDDKTIFLKKVYSWNSTGEKIPTSSKQYIKIDVTARWQIENLEIFYKKLKSEQAAYRIMDQVIESAIKTVVGEYELIETVRSSNDMLDKIDEKQIPSNEAQDSDGLQRIKKGRNMIANEISEITAPKLADYGIKLKDIVIRSSNYSSKVKREVLQTMITERENIAALKISEGEGEKNKWLGKLNKEKQIILSSAKAKAEKLKGEGDATAAAIYNRTYRKNPEFFKFWKTMESYKKTLIGTDITLSTDMDYFNYLYSESGR